MIFYSRLSIIIIIIINHFLSSSNTEKNTLINLILQGLDVLHMDYKELVSKHEESWKVLATFSQLPQTTEGKPLEAYNK